MKKLINKLMKLELMKKLIKTLYALLCILK